MADFLDEKRSEIGARLKELKPLFDEYERLRAAAAALDGLSATPEPVPTGNKSGGAKKAANRKRAKRVGKEERRGRPKGSGKRGVQALALVRQKPGITIPEIAEQMGIKDNYLYRLLPGLAEDGLVKKDGRGWHPKGAE